MSNDTINKFKRCLRDTTRPRAFLLTIDDYRNAINDEIKPSFVNITTITLISKGLAEFDIPKIKKLLRKKTTTRFLLLSSNGRGKIDTSIKHSTRFL